jgi:hypothetical protein
MPHRPLVTHRPLLPFMRPLAEQIRQLIDRRRQQSHSRLIWRFSRRTGMRARRHKHLGPLEALGETDAVVVGQRLVELDHVAGFFFFNVLAQIGHEGFDGGDEVGVGGVEVLEFFEFLFYLWLSVSCSYRLEERGQYSLVFPAILLCHGNSIWEVFLKCRIHDQFLANGVPG